MNLDEDIFSGMFGGLLYGLGIADLAIPIGFLFWAPILFVSLKKIDCSDMITAGLYALYCSVSGIILVLAIPFQYTKIDDFFINFIFVAIFSALSLTHWTRTRKKARRALKNSETK